MRLNFAESTSNDEICSAASTHSSASPATATFTTAWQIHINIAASPPPPPSLFFLHSTLDLQEQLEQHSRTLYCRFHGRLNRYSDSIPTQYRMPTHRVLLHVGTKPSSHCHDLTLTLRKDLGPMRPPMIGLHQEHTTPPGSMLVSAHQPSLNLRSATRQWPPNSYLSYYAGAGGGARPVIPSAVSCGMSRYCDGGGQVTYKTEAGSRRSLTGRGFDTFRRQCCLWTGTKCSFETDFPALAARERVYHPALMECLPRCKCDLYRGAAGRLSQAWRLVGDDPPSRNKHFAALILGID